MFLSFVPIVVWQLGFEESVWRLSAGIIGATQTVSVSIFLWQTKWFGASVSQQALTVVAFVVVVVGFGAALGFVPNPAAVVILALLWSVYLSAHNFWLLLSEGIQDA